MKEVFTNCDKCGKDIHYGEAYIGYTKALETANKTGPDSDEIEVLDAFQVSTLCIKCGGLLYANESIEMDIEVKGKRGLEKREGLMKSKSPKLMTGFLWFVNDGTSNTLKEYEKNRMKDEPPCILSRGNIIPKDAKSEEKIIFDCFRPLYNENISFKLFIFNENIVEGFTKYPVDISEEKEYFKGNFIKKTKSKIIIWGKWSEDANYKKYWPVYIELKR